MTAPAAITQPLAIGKRRTGEVVFSTKRNSTGSFGKVATVLPDRRKNGKMQPNRQPSGVQEEPAGVQPYI
jgi:hypothetical protein